MLIFILTVLFLRENAVAQQQGGSDLCSAKDGSCVLQAIRGCVHLLKDGIPKYGVLTLDPLHIDLLVVPDAPGNIMNVHHTFKNVDLSGLSSADVKAVRLDYDQTELDIEAHIKEPIVLIGNYKSNGKISSYPVDGEGHFNITLVNMKAVLKLKGHKEQRKGKTYVYMEKVRFPFTVDKLNVYFENIHKGNKEMSDNVNLVLNDNWKTVLDEMEPSFEEAIGEAFREIANRIFSKRPLQDLVKP